MSIEAETKLQALRLLVDTQAKDEGLWFEAPDAPTAYIQQALRRLHHAIEEVDNNR